MVIVLFEVTLKNGKMDDYLAQAAGLKAALAKAEGFVRAERFSSLAVEGKLLSMSVWEDEESVAAWRNLVEHRMSQKHGREQDFVDYKITVVEPIRTYGMTERQDAPADSNEFFGLWAGDVSPPAMKGTAMDRDQQLAAWRRKDPAYEGKLFSAISSTGIVCTIGCPAKVYKEENITFYEDLDAAIDDGYRPCKICMKGKGYPTLKRYTTTVPSPLGDIILASDGHALTGLWFADNGRLGKDLEGFSVEQRELPVFDQTRAWLLSYFAGENPTQAPKVRICGSAFLREVCRELEKIPYGQTTTYGTLAKTIGERRGKRVSAQAVGGAVGRNPVSLIVPCHRVIGTGKRLTGYGGGIERKVALLQLEGISTEAMKRPTKGRFTTGR